jgi:hypothetical protein
MQGEDVPQNYTNALKWYPKGDDQGSILPKPMV